MKTFLCLILFFFINQDSAKVVEQNGLMLRLPEKGLEYLSNYTIDVLTNKLTNFEIPTQNFSYLGAKIDLYNMKIDRLRIEDISITTKDHDRLKIVASPVQADVSGNYMAKIIFIKGGGDVTAKATNIDMMMELEIRRTSSDKLEIEKTSFDADFHLSINIDGTHDMFLEAIITVAKSKIRNLISEAVSDVIDDLFKDVNNNTLADFPMSLDLLGINIDYGLMYKPNFYKNAAEFYCHGTVIVDEEKSNECHERNQWNSFALKPSISDTDKIAYLYVSSFTINEALRVAHCQEYLHLNSKSTSSLKNIGSYLNKISALLPEISDEYDIIADVITTNTPIIDIQGDKAKINLWFQVRLYYDDEAVKDDLFISDMTLEATTSLQYRDGQLSFEIDQFDVKSDHVISVSSSFSNLLKCFESNGLTIIKGLLNQLGSSGIALTIPLIDFMQLTNPEGILRDDMLILFSDLILSPDIIK